MAHHATLPIWDEKTPAQKIEAIRQMILDLYDFAMSATNARLLDMLDAAQPADEREAQSIDQMRDLIRAHPNIMAQSCEVGHVVATSTIIDITTGRVLLILHKKLGVWVGTGGHVDDETDIAQVALREAWEESGLPDLRFYPETDQPAPVDFDIHRIPQSGDRPEHWHLDFRYVLATSTPDALNIDPEESLDWRWLTFDEVYAADDIADDIKRLTRKAEAIYRQTEGTR